MDKNLLFLSNGIKLSKEEYCNIGEEKLTSFSIPVVKAAGKYGFKVTMGINKKYAEKMKCSYPVDFFNAEIYRNPFNLIEVYKAYKNICSLMKQRQYSIIHCNTPIGGVLGRICGKKFHVRKVIYTAHGFHFYKGSPLINWLLYYPVERLMAHWTDIIITINQEDFEAAKRFKLRNQGIVYYVPGVGIDVNKYKLKSSKDMDLRLSLGIGETDIVCISIGELNKNKNNRIIVEALKILKNPYIHYILCGSGREKERLGHLAERYGIKKNVHFLGFRSDVKELYQISDIFILPSLREGLSRSLMEAMASGLPCIVSKIRGNVDLIEDSVNGILCPPKSSYEFAEAITRLADNKDLRKKMGSVNLEKIRRYDNSMIEKEIDGIYKKILGCEVRKCPS